MADQNNRQLSRDHHHFNAPAAAGHAAQNVTVRPPMRAKGALRPHVAAMRILLVATLLITAPLASQRDGVSITFLANEGVLISDGAKKVLIDALFEKYGPEYATPADSIQRVLAGAQGAFSGVNAVLVTHRHGDHFHPAPTVQHLLANRRATLVTSNQVVDSLMSMRAVPTISILRRTPARGQRVHEVVNGIPIDILGIAHTGGARHEQVEHLAYIVELGGRRVLHLGDVEASEALFQGFRLDTARIDVALVPFWMTVSDGGRTAITKWIKPKHIVAFHLLDGDTTRGPRIVQDSLPGARAFARSMEVRRY